MKLRSGRSLHTGPSSPTAKTTLRPPLATAPTAQAASNLPPEVKQAILNSRFPPCTLRRHIVSKLLKQHHTPNDARYDRIMRTAAIAWMHDAEKTTYKDVRAEIATWSVVSKEIQSMALATERKWLENKPIDITTFRKFCAESDAKNFECVGQMLVIELFPKQGFITPPSFINEGVPQAQLQIDARDCDALHQCFRLASLLQGSTALSVVAGLGLFGIDLTILEALCNLWLRELQHLSLSVKRVKIIVSMPDLGPSGQWRAGDERGIDTEAILRDFRGAVDGRTKDAGGVDGGDSKNGGKSRNVIMECVY